MTNVVHPTRFQQAAPAAPTFIVCLSFEGVPRGVAGPFESDSDAQTWLTALLGGQDGWAGSVLPLTEPAALPLAAERLAARRQRRHLHIVR